MSLIKLIFIFSLAILVQAKTCPKAPNYAGKFIGPNCQCARGIQSLCSYSSVTLGLTSTWKKGSNIKKLCAAGTPPPRYTAIATFLGPNSKYDTTNYANQHSGLFENCTSTGVKVWDQYCTNNKVWGTRIIKYTGKGDKNDGASYHVIL